MSIREEYYEEAKKLLSNERSIFDCAEDVMFTIYLRECFLTIRGDLNNGIKTKEGYYTKLTEIREGVRDGWKEKRAGK
jgi:hypothetical protein